MRFFTPLFPIKGTIYGGTALLLGLLPPQFIPTAAAGDLKGLQFPEITQRDWYLNNQAKRAIDKDAKLKAQNLGVSVKDKVATVWGTIPSNDVFARAEQALLKIPGIATVINDCRIVPANDPVPQTLADLVNKSLANDSDLQARKFPPMPASTTGRQIVAKPAPDGSTPPGVPIAPPPAAKLLPLAETVKAREEGSGLESQLEAIRASDKRFKELSLSVLDGVVRVNGIVDRMKDALDLADKLNNAPGVKQVVIGKVVEK